MAHELYLNEDVKKLSLGYDNLSSFLLGIYMFKISTIKRRNIPHGVHQDDLF